MKIIVDLDDVLALDSFLNALNKFKNSNYKYSDIKGYYVEELLSKKELEEFRTYLKNNNLYSYAVVAKNSKEVLKKLSKNHEIFIATSCYSEIEKMLLLNLIPYKYNFIKENYPFIDDKNIIFITDKTLIEADIRIDDKIENFSKTGINLLFSAYHNLNLKEELIEKNVIRVNDWLDVEKQIKVFTNK